MELASRTFIVTGGASGLGAGTARLLVERGANVVIADVNASAGEALVGQLGSAARFAKTDVTSPERGQSAVDLAIRDFGALDGLVNCAGILGAARIVGREGPHDLPLFRKVIEVNLIGTFNMLRLAATAMSVNAPSADGERGVVINTASIAAFEGQIGQAAYAASKGGVASLTLPAARELSRLGIRPVLGGPTNTPNSSCRSSKTRCSTERLSGSMGPCGCRRNSRMCLIFGWLLFYTLPNPNSGLVFCAAQKARTG
jgi:NAD(P)-dependent dehydrogenase (short-subunit alcohol dehydrogenase family)